MTEWDRLVGLLAFVGLLTIIILVVLGLLFLIALVRSGLDD